MEMVLYLPVLLFVECLEYCCIKIRVLLGWGGGSTYKTLFDFVLFFLFSLVIRRNSDGLRG